MAVGASQAASALELRLQGVLEAAPEAYVSMDAGGRIVGWNRQAEATFGFSPEEVLGHVLAETIIPPRYRDAHAHGLRHFLSTGEGPVLNRRLQIEALHRDGHEFPVELTIWPLREGDSWTFHAFIRDVTGLRARDSEREAVVADIIAVLAEDGSDALQHMQLAIDLLAVEFRRPARLSEHLELLQKACDRLEGLLKNVHGRAIPLRLKRGDSDLADIWREAWAQLATPRQDRDAELVEERAGANTHSTVDRVGIEQVFRVLFQNSLARCADPLRIEVRCAEDSIDGAAAVQVTVRDNGPPLPGDEWHQVFGVVDFTRLHEPGAELAIAARIIDAHGGHITTSGRYQQGAEFLITLPREAVSG